MTLDDLHQKLNSLAYSGMEDNHFTSVSSKNSTNFIKSHLVKKERRRFKKDLSVQLSLFD